YLQYSVVRTFSVLRKYGEKVNAEVDLKSLTSDEEFGVIRHLATFPHALARSERDREPFILGQYLIGLAKGFNRFYTVHRILEAPEDVKRARMALVFCVNDVLRAGMKLLGIPAPEKM